MSLLTLAAENNLVLGQTQPAMALLDEARTAIGNKTMAGGRLAARRMFLAATALYQARKIADGDAALAKVMHFMRTGSLWLFHMQKVDDYYTGGGSGGVSAARAAIDLYQVVLRDPQPADWLTDPMESLAVLCVPHGLIYEHWFEAAVDRKDHELAVEVADRARRHRFLSTLPLGGRLESLRWVLEGAEGIAAAAGRFAAAGIVEPLPQLQRSARSGRGIAAGPGRRAAGAGQRGEDQEAGPGHDPAHGRWPKTGDRVARDGRAPRSGGDRLSTLENDGGDPEIAAAGPRHAGFLRHQPEPVRLSAEPREVCHLASGFDAAGPRPAIGHVASRIRQHLAELRTHRRKTWPTSSGGKLPRNCWTAC